MEFEEFAKRNLSDKRHRNAENIARDIANEFYRAQATFPAFNSGHEGYAVILEELEELWEEVKDNKRDNEERRIAMEKEAIQVGAMALRFIHDLCGMD